MDNRPEKTGESSSANESAKKGGANIVQTVLRAVAAAMGIAVTVLGILDGLDESSAISMLGIGLACLGISTFCGDDKKRS